MCHRSGVSHAGDGGKDLFDVTIHGHCVLLLAFGLSASLTEPLLTKYVTGIAIQCKVNASRYSGTT
jgi:hypothetical protein